MKKLISAIILLSLTGCTMTGRYYLRNLTDKPASIVFTIKDKGLMDGWDKAKLPYDERVRRIRFGMFRKFSKELEIQKIDEYTLQVSIPPKSTVFIGYSGRNLLPSLRKAIVRIENNETDIELKEAKVKSAGLLKYTGHYDINP